MVKSGIKYGFGYGFWGPNGHDGIWHIALAKSLSKTMSLDNPVFAGEILKNYHLGFDIFLAFINKLTKIPISILYFQILPVLFSLLIGWLVYLFVKLWRGSKAEALWSLVFVYFGSSFGFIVTFLRNGIFTGESMFWSQQAISTLVNPPFALSLIFILSGLIFLLKYKKTRNIKFLILTSVFFGILVQTKIYAGILVLGGLFVSGVYMLFKHKKNYILLTFLYSLIISLLVFLPFNKLSTSILVWQPFWFLETMMSYSDRLGWERFYSAMTTYKMGQIWLKAILAYGVAFVIFLVGNIGSRIIGFYFFVKVLGKKIKIDEYITFIFSVMVAAVLIPMFFVQKGTPWNTIQFFYYFLFFFSIFAGISTKLVLEKTKSTTRNILLFFIFLFVALGIWSTLQHYLPKTPPAKISNEEYKALHFLSEQPSGVVLTYPFDKYKAGNIELVAPRPLYLYESTSYVSGFSNKQVFLEDEVNANIMGYDWKIRREEVLEFISNLDIDAGRDFLKSNDIKYLYLAREISPLPGEQLKLGIQQLDLVRIFENSTISIYRVE